MKVKVIRDTMNEELEVLFSHGFIKEDEIYEAYDYYDEFVGNCICIYSSGEEFNIYEGEYEVVDQ